MAKSLKEALLERFSDLQELGIAPTSAPAEDDGPAIVIDVAQTGGRDSGMRRARPSRGGAYDDEATRGGDVPIRPRSRPRRSERGNERARPGGERFRRGGDRTALDGPPTGDIPPATDRPAFTPRPTFGGPPRTGDRPLGPRPMGDRPPFANRPPGPPRPGLRPAGPPPREIGVTERLQQRAEQRRAEEGQRDQLKVLMASMDATEITDELYDKFLGDLALETGALPPLDRVIEAITLAGNLEPSKVGQQVRMLYRRSRPRPASVSG